MPLTAKHLLPAATLLLLLLLWSWGLGQLPLFDWDEINFAEISREMYVSGNYLQPTIDYRPFHEKPPLFAWMQLGLYKLIGPGELAARLPNVICGGLTLLVLFITGKRHGSTELGLWTTAFMGLSLLPGLYFRSGIIDPWFNLFILLALLPLVSTMHLRPRHLLFAGLCLGLAILTKGPVAALIVGLVCALLLLLRTERKGRRALQYAGVGVIALLPAAVWLALVWRVDDGFFAREFFTYQWRLLTTEDAGHGGFPGYHVVVLMLGCFPASVFALTPLLRRREYDAPVDGGMRMLFWVVLIVFSVVSTKIVHYSSLCYFSLAWFAARWVTDQDYRVGLPKGTRRATLGIWTLYGLATLVAAVVTWNLPKLTAYLDDPEILKRLDLPVDWPWYTIVPGLLVAGYLILSLVRKLSVREAAGGQLLLMLVFSLSGLAVFGSRIQLYTQGPNLNFYRELAGQDVYLDTYGFKSYIPEYYGEVKPFNAKDVNWKLSGPIERPLYFAAPLRKEGEVREYVPDAELLYRLGGFVYFRRPAQGGSPQINAD